MLIFINLTIKITTVMMTTTMSIMLTMIVTTDAPFHPGRSLLQYNLL